MPRRHLISEERVQIQVLLEEGYGVRAIARRLGRSPSTISRELGRNGTPYNAKKAQERYRHVRKSCRRPPSISYLPLWRYVFDAMNRGWSPEQISGRLWLDFPGQPRMRISTEAIYQSLYRDEKLRNALLGCLRRAHPRRHRRGQRKPTRPIIPNRVDISCRPPEVDARQRYGDWEGDLVLGANQKGAIVTLVERKSLFLRAALVPSRHAHGVAQAITGQFRGFPAGWLRTLTLDNGSEFAHHEQITEQLGAAVYFARPYSAWERGLNENTNGLLRQYLPKSTSFQNLTQHQIQAIVNEINQRPRKKLGYRTPLEVLKEQSVALET